MWLQKTISLHPRPRGFHLVTGELLSGIPEIERFQVGIAHLFMAHTSAKVFLGEPCAFARDIIET